MDEADPLATARYVELNPVRARLVRKPGIWPWSSARAHLAGRDDDLVRVTPLLRRVPDWARFLAGGMADEDIEQRKHSRSGRPWAPSASSSAWSAVSAVRSCPESRGASRRKRSKAREIRILFPEFPQFPLSPNSRIVDRRRHSRCLKILIWRPRGPRFWGLGHESTEATHAKQQQFLLLELRRYLT